MREASEMTVPALIATINVHVRAEHLGRPLACLTSARRQLGSLYLV